MAVDVLQEPLDAPDLLRGGLYFSLMRRFGVESSRAAHEARRAIVFGLALFIPVCGLSILEGHALPGCCLAVPFLYDVSGYTRALLVVPLLLIARPVLAAAWRRAGAKFRERELLKPEGRAEVEALAARVTRFGAHLLPNAVCLLLALLFSTRLVMLVESERVNTWFAQPDPNGSGSKLTLAGLWSALAVHGTIFYLSLLWVWRLGLWYRFLWGVSRLHLALQPVHPDRAAGLGFIGKTIAATAPLVLGWSIGLAGPAASLMIHSDQRLESFLPMGIGLLSVVLILFVLPPVVIFAPHIVRARRDALEDWGKRMARTGEGIRCAAEGEEAGGLEDLQIAVTAVRSTLPFPLALSHLLPMLAGIAVPAFGLVLLAVPFGRVIDELLSLLR